MSEQTSIIWRFGPFSFDPAASELTNADKPVSIEPQSLLLLEYLILNRSRVVTRDELIKAIWDGRIISDWAVSAAIKALRKALGDGGKDSQFVRTVHSKGYRFIAEVEEKRNALADLPIVLVRIFRSASSAPEDSYLANGLTEDIITDLSRVDGLSILSYNTSKAVGDAEHARDLGVKYIVDGNVRRIGETIRINVNLLDGRGDRQVWSERFDLTIASLLAGQDRIVARLYDILCPGQDWPEGQRKVSRNPVAYDHYLRGRYAYFRYEPTAFIEALDHFTRAGEIEEDFADAFAQQAYCRTTLYVFGLPGADKTLQTAEDLARHAISLDENSALGHARLGWVLGYIAKFDDVVVAFDKAIQCDPDNPEVLFAYGETMNRLAQPERAMHLINSAFAKDSYFPPSWEFAKGHTQVLLGDHSKSILHLQSVLGRTPRFVPALVQLTRAQFEQEDLVAASETVEQIRLISPKYSLAHAERMFPYPDSKQSAKLIGALSASGLT